METQTMKRLQYLVRISRNPRSDPGASVPSLPGCIATGKTLDSILCPIEQAIAPHVRGVRDDGLPVPRPVSGPSRGARASLIYTPPSKWPPAGAALDGLVPVSENRGHQRARCPTR